MQGQFIARYRVVVARRPDSLGSQAAAPRKGTAALDFYDAGRVLRGWHSHLVAEPLPDIDELADPAQAREAKRRLYGDADVRHNRAALVHLLDNYGLYPWRVQLIVEGPSEENLLGELLRRQGGTPSQPRGARRPPWRRWRPQAHR